MRPAEILKPLGVFVVVLALIVAASAVAPAVFGSDSTATNETSGEGEYYSDQSPAQYQPDNVLNEDISDAEDGDLSITAETNGTKRVLIDTRHANDYEEDELEPIVNALVEAGHEVRFRGESDDIGFGSSSNYNATLRNVSALLIIAPTESFTDEELKGIKAFAEGGGRVVAMGEPTKTSAGSIFTGSTTTRSTVSELSMEFGMKLGTDTLYNIDDEHNDDNYISIHADTVAPGPVTSNVGTIDLETSGYIVMTNDSNARTKFRAAPGTQRMTTRRSGEYPVVARKGNFVLVADSTFITPTEIYDADNEVFTSNLLNFLLTGDKPDDVPSAENETTTDDDF